MQKSSELSGDPQKILMCPSCLNPLRFKEDNGTTISTTRKSSSSCRNLWHLRSTIFPQIWRDQRLINDSLHFLFTSHFSTSVFKRWHWKVAWIYQRYKTHNGPILPGLTLIFSGWNSLIFGVKIQVLENVAGFLITKIEMFLVMVLTCD